MLLVTCRLETHPSLTPPFFPAVASHWSTVNSVRIIISFFSLPDVVFLGQDLVSPLPLVSPLQCPPCQVKPIASQNLPFLSSKAGKILFIFQEAAR